MPTSSSSYPDLILSPKQPVEQQADQLDIAQKINKDLKQYPEAMLSEQFITTLLRIGQLAFSAAALGLTASYLHNHDCTLGRSHTSFVYVEVVTALGLVFSLLLLIPGPSKFIELSLDFTLFILFITAFDLIANFIGPLDCGSIWDWRCITGDTICQTLKTNIFFCFLAAIFFLVSGLLGIWRALKHKLSGAAAPDA